MNSLVEQREEPEAQAVEFDGTRFDGSWDEIVRRMRDAKGDPSHSMREFMTNLSNDSFSQTGVRIPTNDAESFLRGSAVAGLLRIVR